MSQKFEIGENTHHEIHLEKDKVPVFLNHYFWKNIEIDSSVRKASIFLFSNYLVRLIHLFERLLFFYFPIIWLDWFICYKCFYYFIFQLFGQIEEYKQNNFPLTGGSVGHSTFHCRKLSFQPLRELEVIIEQGTWNGYGKRLKENYIFSLFLLLLCLFQESKIKYILFLQFAWKNCAVKSFLGWTFFPFVRINEVLFYLQRWQVWLLPICRRNISAAIKRQSSALSDF